MNNSSESNETTSKCNDDDDNMFTVTYEQKAIIHKPKAQSNPNQFKTKTNFNNQISEITTRRVHSTSKHSKSPPILISKNLFRPNSNHSSIENDSSNNNINAISTRINRAISNPTKTVKEFCDKLNKR
jgi:hypothetical protein